MPTPDSEQYNDHISSLVNGDAEIPLGFSDKLQEGNWINVYTGKAISWTQWGATQPDNHGYRGEHFAFLVPKYFHSNNLSSDLPILLARNPLTGFFMTDYYDEMNSKYNSWFESNKSKWRDGSSYKSQKNQKKLTVICLKKIVQGYVGHSLN